MYVEEFGVPVAYLVMVAVVLRVAGVW